MIELASMEHCAVHIVLLCTYTMEVGRFHNFYRLPKLESQATLCDPGAYSSHNLPISTMKLPSWDCMATLRAKSSASELYLRFSICSHQWRPGLLLLLTSKLENFWPDFPDYGSSDVQIRIGILSFAEYRRCECHDDSVDKWGFNSAPFLFIQFGPRYHCG